MFSKYTPHYNTLLLVTIVFIVALVLLLTSCSDPVGPPDTDAVVCVDWPTGGWLCCNDATQSCTRYWEV